MKRLVINDLYLSFGKFDLPDGELLQNLYFDDLLSCNISDLANCQLTSGEHNDEFLTNGVRKIEGKKVISTLNSWGRTYNSINPTDGNVCIRPVCDYGSIDKSFVKIVRNLNDYTILVEYGEYPQEILNLSGDSLSSLRSNLEKTGNYYTLGKFESLNLDDNLISKLEEYVDKRTGIKYLFDEVNSDCFIVKPILWIVDLRTSKMITQDAIIGGIPFSSTDDISDTYAIDYLNETFAKEIIQSHLKEKNTDKKKLSGLEFLDHYTINNQRTDFVEKIPDVIKSKKEKGVKAIEKRGYDLLKQLNKSNFRDNDFRIIIDYSEGFDPDVVNEYGNNMLHMCAKNGHTKTFLLLAATGLFDINKQNNYGTTALMTASINGHFEIVKACIELGCDVNIRCSDGDTAIMSAKRHNHKEIFDYLLEHGAYVNYTNNNLETLQTLPSSIEFTDTYRIGEEVMENPYDVIEQAKRELELIKKM